MKYQAETWIQRVGKKRALDEAGQQLSVQLQSLDEKDAVQPKCYLAPDLDAAVEEIWNPELSKDEARE